MENAIFYCRGRSGAIGYAEEFLRNAGMEVICTPSNQSKYLLLDVPSFRPDEKLRDGSSLECLLSSLPEDITVIGGGLTHPALQGYRCVDLLRDPQYLAKNAYLTAECALDVAMPYMTIALRDCPVAILGWGRIGKCLAKIFGALGSKVSIAARKEGDLASIQSLGYQAMSYPEFKQQLGQFRLIFNTVPALVLEEADIKNAHPRCVKIDLASITGIEGEDVIQARGLPGLHIPEESGCLIASTALRLLKEAGL